MPGLPDYARPRADELRALGWDSSDGIADPATMANRILDDILEITDTRLAECLNPSVTGHLRQLSTAIASYPAEARRRHLTMDIPTVADVVDAWGSPKPSYDFQAEWPDPDWMGEGELLLLLFGMYGAAGVLCDLSAMATNTFVLPGNDDRLAERIKRTRNSLFAHPIGHGKKNYRNLRGNTGEESSAWSYSARAGDPAEPELADKDARDAWQHGLGDLKLDFRYEVKGQGELHDGSLRPYPVRDALDVLMAVRDALASLAFGTADAWPGWNPDEHETPLTPVFEAWDPIRRYQDDEGQWRVSHPRFPGEEHWLFVGSDEGADLAGSFSLRNVFCYRVSPDGRTDESTAIPMDTKGLRNPACFRYWMWDEAAPEGMDRTLPWVLVTSNAYECFSSNDHDHCGEGLTGGDTEDF